MCVHNAKLRHRPPPKKKIYIYYCQPPQVMVSEQVSNQPKLLSPPPKKKNHWIYLTPTFSVRGVIFSNNKDLYISYYYFLLLSFFNYYAIKSTLCNTVQVYAPQNARNIYILFNSWEMGQM